MRWGNKQKEGVQWIREKEKAKEKKKEENGRNEQERERERNKKGVPLLFKIYGNRFVSFCWSKN